MPIELRTCLITTFKFTLVLIDTWTGSPGSGNQIKSFRYFDRFHIYDPISISFSFGCRQLPFGEQKLYTLSSKMYYRLLVLPHKASPNSVTSWSTKKQCYSRANLHGNLVSIHLLISFTSSVLKTWFLRMRSNSVENALNTKCEIYCFLCCKRATREDSLAASNWILLAANVNLWHKLQFPEDN